MKLDFVIQTRMINKVRRQTFIFRLSNSEYLRSLLCVVVDDGVLLEVVAVPSLIVRVDELSVNLR